MFDNSVCIIFKDLKNFNKSEDIFIFINFAIPSTIKAILQTITDDYISFNPGNFENPIIRVYTADINLCAAADDFFRDECEDADSFDWEVAYDCNHVVIPNITMEE